MRTLIESILDTDDDMDDVIYDNYRDIIFLPGRDKELAKLEDIKVNGSTLSFTIRGYYMWLDGAMFRKLGYKTYNISTPERIEVHVNFYNPKEDISIPPGTTINFMSDVPVSMRCDEITLRNVTINAAGKLEIGYGNSTACIPGFHGCKFNIKHALEVHFRSKDDMFDDKCIVKCNNLKVSANSENWDPKVWRVRDWNKAQLAMKKAYEGKEPKDLIGTNKIDTKEIYIYSADYAHPRRYCNCGRFNIRGGKLIFAGEDEDID